jgi:N-acetylglucosamine malate deacetylase 2
MIVLSHPDDETFFAAGTIARYVEEGAKVTVICGTRGERGATGGLCSVEELPAVREAELRDAMRILGVTDLQLLPYQDQQLSAAPIPDIRCTLVQRIRDTKPQVVITFDPHGANQHPDHIAISRFTSDAVSAAADPRWCPGSGSAHQIGRLLWQSETPVYKLAQMKALERQPGLDFLIDTEAWWQRKKAALEAHRTQLPGFPKMFFQGDVKRTLSFEAFRVGWGPRPRKVPASDLFAL